jgi:hypothetical protein
MKESRGTIQVVPDTAQGVHCDKPKRRDVPGPGQGWNNFQESPLVHFLSLSMTVPSAMMAPPGILIFSAL